MEKLNWNRNKPNLQCNRSYEFHICTALMHLCIYFLFILVYYLTHFVLEKNKVGIILKNEGGMFEILMESIILLK